VPVTLPPGRGRLVQVERDWIRDRSHHDRNRRGRALGVEGGSGRHRDDDVHSEPGKLRSVLERAVHPPARPPGFEPVRLTLRVAELLERAAECIETGVVRRRRGPW